MKKTMRTIRYIVAFILLLTFLTASALAQGSGSYSDTRGHWAETAILRWSELGVLKGSAGKFRPNDPISRAELAAIINRICSFPTSNVSVFSDTAGKWYEADVNALALQSIYLEIKGASNGEKALSREEAVEMLYRAFMTTGLSTYSVMGAAEKFTDQDEISTEYVEAVDQLRRLGFINGFADGSFHPQEHFTRAQVVTILNKMIGFYITEPGEYEIPSGANICVAAPGVTLTGNNISYLCILPQAAEGLTVLQSPPKYGVVWSLHKYQDDKTLSLKNRYGGSLRYNKLRTAVEDGFAGGTGRRDDPFLIATEAQLRGLSSFLSSDYSGYHFRLKNNITLTTEWTPLGAAPEMNKTNDEYYWCFCGTLDGGGYKVENMSITSDNNDSFCLGLFGFLKGTVKNLSIQGEITARSVAPNDPDEVVSLLAGGIAGRAVGLAVIENCHADVIISIEGPDTMQAGGIVGEILSGGVNGCSSSGSITASSQTTKEERGAVAGGIAATATTPHPLNVSNCVSDAAVTAIGGYYNCSGGIVGNMPTYSRVESCFSSGTVTAKGSLMQNNAGGIVGQLVEKSSAVLYSGSTATVTATGNPGIFNASGGIVGSAYENCLIADCYSAGRVSADGVAVVGGLVGRAECRITTSYTVANVSTTGVSLGSLDENGLVGTVRDFIVTKGCGVFNVADPHFISYDEKNNINQINYVEGHSLSDPATYKEIGSFLHSSGNANWDFDKVWTFTNLNIYPYPILKSIPENVQLTK